MTLPVGSDTAFWMYATGCDTSSPLWFTFVGGALPTGMTMGTFQTSSSGNIIGIPSVRGTYTFTVQAQDGAGGTDQETFTIKVV